MPFGPGILMDFSTTLTFIKKNKKLDVHVLFR